MRHLLNKPIIALLIVIFVLLIAFPAAAQSGWQPTHPPGHGGAYVQHVVKPGERLASVARQYCTTWEEIYYLNRHIIGLNPDYIYPGMWLTVPNCCGGWGPGHPPVVHPPTAHPPVAQPPIAHHPGWDDACYGVYDRGWMPHAKGHVNGKWYHVRQGDTWYSIGKRFGIPYQHLQRANHSHRLLAGWRIVIPCLHTGSGPEPTPTPTQSPVPPTPTVGPKVPYIYVISPLAYAVLPTTFEVNGAAWNITQNNLLVKVINQQGNVLAQQNVSLQQVDGVEGSTSGQICLNIQDQEQGCIVWNSQLSASVQDPNQDVAYWSTQLTVNVPPSTPGRIEVTAPDTNAKAIVNPVYLGQGGSGAVDYPPGQCQISVAAGSPAYDQPNGTVEGQFVSAGTLEAQRREMVDSSDWYRVQVSVNPQPRDLWVSSVNLTAIGGGCY